MATEFRGSLDDMDFSSTPLRHLCCLTERGDLLNLNAITMHSLACTSPSHKGLRLNAKTETYRDILPLLPSTTLDLFQVFVCDCVAGREVAGVDLGVNFDSGIFWDHFCVERILSVTS